MTDLTNPNPMNNQVSNETDPKDNLRQRVLQRAEEASLRYTGRTVAENQAIQQAKQQAQLEQDLARLRSSYASNLGHNNPEIHYHQNRLINNAEINNHGSDEHWGTTATGDRTVNAVIGGLTGAGEVATAFGGTVLSGYTNIGQALVGHDNLVTPEQTINFLNKITGLNALRTRQEQYKSVDTRKAEAELQRIRHNENLGEWDKFTKSLGVYWDNPAYTFEKSGEEAVKSLATLGVIGKVLSGTRIGATGKLMTGIGTMEGAGYMTEAVRDPNREADWHTVGNSLLVGGGAGLIGLGVNRLMGGADIDAALINASKHNSVFRSILGEAIEEPLQNQLSASVAHREETGKINPFFEIGSNMADGVAIGLGASSIMTLPTYSKDLAGKVKDQVNDKIIHRVTSENFNNFIDPSHKQYDPVKAMQFAVAQNDSSLTKSVRTSLSKRMAQLEKDMQTALNNGDSVTQKKLFDEYEKETKRITEIVKLDTEFRQRKKETTTTQDLIQQANGKPAVSNVSATLATNGLSSIDKRVNETQDWKNNNDGKGDFFSVNVNGKEVRHYRYAEASKNELVPTSFKNGRGIIYVHADAKNALDKMIADAKKVNVNLSVVSGFRSIKDQKGINDANVGKKGVKAYETSAPAGYSQHHTGLAIDFNSVNPKDFEKGGIHYEAGQWLKKNASEYGFEMSFDNNNADGVAHEAWQFLYTGSERARQLSRPLGSSGGKVNPQMDLSNTTPNPAFKSKNVKIADTEKFLKDNMKNIRLKSSEAIQGGETNENVLKFLALMDNDSVAQDILHVSSINDTWHKKNRPKSKHTLGKSFDFTPKDASPQAYLAIGEKLKRIAEANGYEVNILLEHKEASKTDSRFKWFGGTGNHIHVDVIGLKSNRSTQFKPVTFDVIKAVGNDRKHVIASVYSAFRTVGFSHNQALSLTAEVGRENEFNIKYLFGIHSDLAKNAGGKTITNHGFFSWNQGREKPLMNNLRQQGLLDSPTQIKMDQRSLVEMAKFVRQELQQSKQPIVRAFLDNPNVDPNDLEFGAKYLGWAKGQTKVRGGASFDSNSHEARRQRNLREVIAVASSLNVTSSDETVNQENQSTQQRPQQDTSIDDLIEQNNRLLAELAEEERIQADDKYKEQQAQNIKLLTERIQELETRISNETQEQVSSNPDGLIEVENPEQQANAVDPEVKKEIMLRFAEFSEEEIASLPKGLFSEEEMLMLRERTQLQQDITALHDVLGVNNQIFVGGGGNNNLGIQQYLQRLDTALESDNITLFTKSFDLLQSFSQSHRNKLEALKEAADLSPTQDKPVSIARVKDSNEWEVGNFFRSPEEAKKNGGAYFYHIKGVKTMLDNVEKESEALDKTELLYATASGFLNLTEDQAEFISAEEFDTTKEYLQDLVNEQKSLRSLTTNSEENLAKASTNKVTNEPTTIKPLASETKDKEVSKPVTKETKNKVSSKGRITSLQQDKQRKEISYEDLQQLQDNNQLMNYVDQIPSSVVKQAKDSNTFVANNSIAYELGEEIRAGFLSMPAMSKEELKRGDYAFNDNRLKAYRKHFKKKYAESDIFAEAFDNLDNFIVNHDSLYNKRHPVHFLNAVKDAFENAKSLDERRRILESFEYSPPNTEASERNKTHEQNVGKTITEREKETTDDQESDEYDDGISDWIWGNDTKQEQNTNEQENTEANSFPSEAELEMYYASEQDAMEALGFVNEEANTQVNNDAIDALLYDLESDTYTDDTYSDNISLDDVLNESHENEEQTTVEDTVKVVEAQETVQEEEITETTLDEQDTKEDEAEETNEETQFALFTPMTAEEITKEKDKPYGQQDLLRMHFDLRANAVLAITKNYWWEFSESGNHEQMLNDLGHFYHSDPNIRNNQINQMADFYVFINGLRQHINSTLDKSYRKQFRYNDLKYFLVNDQVEFDENVITAMALSAYSYVITESTVTANTKGDFLTKIGLGSHVESLNNPDEIAGNFKYLGNSLAFDSLKIGKTVLKNLGIKAKQNAPEGIEEKLASSLGHLLLEAMRKNNLVYIQSIPTHGINQYIHTLNHGSQFHNPITDELEIAEDFSAKYTLPYIETKAQNLFFVSFNASAIDYEFEKDPVKEKAKVIKAKTKDTKSLLLNMFHENDALRYPSLEKIKSVDRKVNRGASRISRLQRLSMAKMQNQAMSIDQSMHQVLTSLLDLDRENTLISLGAKVSEEELKNTHIDLQDAKKDKASGIERDLEHGLEWAEIAQDKPFYDRLFGGQNFRIHPASNVFNMQSSKLHRVLGNFVNHEVTFDPNEEYFVRDDKGKITGLTSKAKFFKSLAENMEGSEDFIKEQLKNIRSEGTVDKVDAEAFLPAFEKYLSQDFIQDAVKVLQQVLNKENVNKADLKKVFKAVEAGDMNGQSLRALIELAKYQQARDNDTEFSTHMMLSSDGINNGIAIGFMLQGVADTEFLERVGIFTHDSEFDDYFEARKDKGYKDFYSGLMNIFKSAFKSQEEMYRDLAMQARAYKNFKLAEYYNRLANNLVVIQKHSESLLKRATLKEILIPFSYGAGLNTLSRTAFNTYKKDFYKIVMELHGTVPNEVVKQFEQELRMLSGNNDFTFRLDSNGKLVIKEQSFELLLSQIENTYSKSMKEVIKSAVTEYAGNYMKSRDKTSAMHTITDALTRKTREFLMKQLVDKVNQELEEEMQENSSKYAQVKIDLTNFNSNKPEEEKITLAEFIGIPKDRIKKEVDDKLDEYSPVLQTSFTRFSQDEQDGGTGIRISAKEMYPTGMNNSISHIKGGIQNTFNLPAYISRLTDKGLLASSALIQHTDARTTSHASIFSSVGALNIHDANATAINGSYEEMARTQNKAFLNAIAENNAVTTSYNAMINALLSYQNLVGDLSILNELPTDVREKFNYSVQRLLELNNEVATENSKEKNKKREAPNLEEVVETLASDIHMVASYVSETENNKFNILQSIKTGQQYGGEFGQYSPTDTDRVNWENNRRGTLDQIRGINHKTYKFLAGMDQLDNSFAKDYEEAQEQEKEREKAFDSIRGKPVSLKDYAERIKYKFSTGNYKAPLSAMNKFDELVSRLPNIQIVMVNDLTKVPEDKRDTVATGGAFYQEENIAYVYYRAKEETWNASKLELINNILSRAISTEKVNQAVSDSTKEIESLNKLKASITKYLANDKKKKRVEKSHEKAVQRLNQILQHDQYHQELISSIDTEESIRDLLVSMMKGKQYEELLDIVKSFTQDEANTETEQQPVEQLSEPSKQEEKPREKTKENTDLSTWLENLQGKPVKEFLDSLSKYFNTKSKEREVQKHLLDLFRPYMEENTELKIVTLKQEEIHKDIKEKFYASYDVVNDVIILNETLMENKSAEQKMQYVLHELIHSITEKQLMNPPENQVAFNNAVFVLENLRSQLEVVANRSNIDILHKASSSVSELVAYGSTDPIVASVIAKLNIEATETAFKNSKDKVQSYLVGSGNNVRTMTTAKPVKLTIIRSLRDALLNFRDAIFALFASKDRPTSKKTYSNFTNALNELVKSAKEAKLNRQSTLNFAEASTADSVINTINSLDSTGLTEEMNEHLNKMLNEHIKPFFDNHPNQASEIKDTVDNLVGFDNTPVTLGFSMSDKELYIYNVAKKVFEYYLNDTKTASSRAGQEMTRIYNDVVKQFNAQDFDTRQQYQFVLHSKDNNVATFMAMILASQEVKELMNQERQRVKGEANTFFNKIVNLFGKLMDYFTQKTLNTRQGTISDEVQAIMEHFSSLDYRRVNPVVDVTEASWEQFTRGVNLVNKGILKTADTGANLFRNSSSKVTRKLGNVMKFVTDPNTHLNEVLKGLEDKDGRLGFFGELLNEIVENIPVTDSLGLASMYKEQIDKARQDTMSGMTRVLEKSFNKELTEAERKAITKAILKTDAQSLMRHYNEGKAIQLMTDQKALNKEINSLITWIESNHNSDIANDMIKRTKELGYYLANEEVTGHLLKNPEAIAVSLGTQYQKDLKDMDRKTRDKVDALATLYGLQYAYENVPNSTIRRLFRNETKGMKAILQAHKTLVKESKQEFKGNPLNYMKGFLPEKNNPYKSLKYATVDEVDNLKEEGWELVGDEYIGQDEEDFTDPRYLMIHKDIRTTEYVSGVLSLEDTASKGETLVHHKQTELMKQIHSGKVQSRKDQMSENHQDYDPKDHTNKVVAVYGEEGSILEYRYEMKGKTKDYYLERSTDVIEMLAILSGRLVHNKLVKKQQEKVVEILYQDYKENFKKEPQHFIFVSPESTDPKIVEMWRAMPYSAKQQVYRLTGKKNGIWVRKRAYNMTFGFKAWSITELFDKVADERNVMEKIIIGILKVIFPEKTKATAAKIQNYTEEIVKFMKDIIVIRSGAVLLGNIQANILLLLANGISPIQVATDMVRSWQQWNEYNKLNKRINDIKASLRVDGKNTKLTSELRNLERQFDNLEITKYAKAGLVSSIVEDVSKFALDNKYRSDMEKELEKFTKIIPKGMRNVFNEFLINNGSNSHNFMVEATRWSDFFAKYSLAQHNAKRGMSFKQTLIESQRAFINYAIPTSRELDTMNRLGLVMFTKFWLRFQRVLMKLIRKNPATVMASIAFSDAIQWTDIHDPYMFMRIGNNPLEASVLELPSTLDEPMFVNLLAGTLY